MHRITILATIVIALALFAPLHVFAQTQSLEGFDQRVGEVVERLSRLRSMGGNVTSLVEEVNKAIHYAESGDADSANRILDRVEANITSLEPVVEHEYKVHTIEKYGIVAFLLALPIIVYIGLPRLYLALWFRLRRKWIVEE